MASSRNRRAALVGAFVIGGALLAVGAVGFFGAGHLFQKKVRYVCYFPGSVNGLAIGAAVKVRGVPIGQVFDMLVRYRQSPDDTSVPVFIEVRVKRLADLGGPSDLSEAALRELIDRGLRAQLRSESLVTGQLYVDLDLYPTASPPRFAGVDGHGAYPEIPTMPSAGLPELTATLQQALSEVRAADLPATIQAIRSAVQGVDALVHGRELTAAIGAVPPALSSVGRAADRVGAEVGPIGSSVQATLLGLRHTIDSLDRAVVDTRALVAPDGAAAVRLADALGSVDRAAHSVRELADFLQRNPNAVLVGKKR